ncbi:MAG: hypothetical protein HND52_01865 [Ignavibacteriae bacterium]|nr:hypothetical protein [Ignavibacteriota bacterium]NOG96697.1 hypothetical protein [Ignavibacteriota bacterium]
MLTLIKKIFTALIILLSLTTISSAQNIFIIVIDGSRYTETFGAEDKYMPKFWYNLREEGTIFTNFWNEGYTSTIPGHSSIVSGVWEYPPNNGSEPPENPTIFECYRKQKNIPEEKVWVVAGADKLESIAYSSDEEYGEDYCASVETNNYTGDLDTYENLIEIIEDEKPSLVLVNLRQTDIAGHSGVWDDYVSAIRQADSLIFDLWNVVNSDSSYSDNTTFFVTNDHGRHDDEHGGFRHHGDDCVGCAHLMLFAAGPDFVKGAVSNSKTSQLNIAPTIAEILKFNMPHADSTSLIGK